MCSSCKFIHCSLRLWFLGRISTYKYTNTAYTDSYWRDECSYLYIMSSADGCKHLDSIFNREQGIVDCSPSTSSNSRLPQDINPGKESNIYYGLRSYTSLIAFGKKISSLGKKVADWQGIDIWAWVARLGAHHCGRKPPCIQTRRHKTPVFTSPRGGDYSFI